MQNAKKRWLISGLIVCWLSYSALLLGWNLIEAPWLASAICLGKRS